MSSPSVCLDSASSSDLTLPAVELEWATPYIEAAKMVFSTMLQTTIEPLAPNDPESLVRKHDVSGIIGFSGAVKGTLVVSLSKTVALAAAHALLGDTLTEINADVLDTVGELTNMIGGKAKEKIETAGVSLGLPTVVAGPGHVVAFDSSALVRAISFSTPHGPMSIEVCMKASGN